MAGLTPKKKLRRGEFIRLAALRGWTTQDEIAHALHVSQSQVSRILDGLVRPGERFIAGCVAVWGSVAYDVLLEDDESTEEAPTDEAVA